LINTNAGLGLFTARDIADNRFICAYEGRETDDCDEDVANGHQGIWDNHHMHTNPLIPRYTVASRECPGYYCNDPLGHHDFINAYIRPNADGRPEVWSTRNISAHEEIYIAYGATYWSIFHHECNEEDHEDLLAAIYHSYGQSVMDHIFDGHQYGSTWLGPVTYSSEEDSDHTADPHPLFSQPTLAATFSDEDDSDGTDGSDDA
jgi:hypothetical protein